MSRFELLNDAEEVLLEDANVFEPYPNEKIRLKLHTGEKYEQLKASIIANGIIQPIIAMPSTNRGMLISIAGANRISIAKELNIKVPYQLKTNLTQEQADSICIDTNLLNRQHDDLLPSEISWLLKTKYEILNHQGKKNNTTSRNDYAKLEEDFKIKRRSIQLYIRLTNLTDELLKMVDDNKIKFVSGVSLSFLKTSEMNILSDYITINKYKLTTRIAEHLKKLSQETVNNIDVKSILDEYNKPVDKKPYNISRKTMKQISEYIPEGDFGKLDLIILDSIKLYYGIT